MGKRLFVALAALFALQTGCEDTVSARTGEDKSPEEKQRTYEVENQILKELKERGWIDDKTVYKQDDVPKIKEFIKEKVDTVYRGMDGALRSKNLPQFVEVYREAKKINDNLAGISPALADQSALEMFVDLTEATYGNINTLIAHHPEMLENWPDNCGQIDYETRDAVQKLKEFHILHTEDLGESTKGIPGQYVVHEDAALITITTKNIHPLADSVDGGRFSEDGTRSYYRYGPKANIFNYSLYTNTSTGDLSSRVDRECSFIDLGADGLDRCDARLNGIDEAGIKAANDKARACMAKTIEVLKRRYTGTGYIK